MSGITGDSISIGGLLPGHSYIVFLGSECEGGAILYSDTTYFTTSCTRMPIPYVYDFEDTESFSCWSVIAGHAVIATNNSSHNGSRHVRFNGNNPRILAFPNLEQEISTLTLKFWTRPENHTNGKCGTFSVGYLTDLSDTGSFVAIETYSYNEWDSATYQEKRIYFTGAPAGSRIAFRHDANSTSWFWFVDDVEVSPTPSCPNPNSLSATGITPHEATLEWVSNGSESSWDIYYKKTTDTAYTLVSAVSNNPYTLTGLAGNTSYNWYVKARCGIDDVSEPSASKTFSTKCDVITEFPWTEGFEDVTVFSDASTPVMPNCWERINTCSSTQYAIYPTVTSGYAHSGYNSLRFHSPYSNYDPVYNPQDQYAILPAMEDLNSLTMTFYARKFPSGADFSTTFHVGVMEDSNFVELQAFEADNYALYSIDFDQYTGSGNRIAFKLDAAHSDDNNNSYNAIFVDDITVEKIDLCKKALNLTISDTTAHDATLTWEIHDTFFPNSVCYRPLSDTAFVRVDNATSPFSLSGLDRSTSYEVFVETLCEDTVNHSDTILFTTQCGEIPIPYADDFESDDIFKCWTQLSGSTSRIETASYAHSGEHFLHFQSSRSTMIELPSFEQEANTLRITFWTRPENCNKNQCGSFSVGYLTDPADTSTFVSVSTYHYNDWTDNIYAQKTEYFTDAPAGARIAFLHTPQTEDWYWYVDDITVTEIPDCPNPNHPGITGVTTTTASLTWDSLPGATAWNIHFKSAGEDTFAMVSNLTSNSYELTGLQSNTTYEWYVEAVCGSEETSLPSDTLSFRTQCMVFPLPYEYDFETPDPFFCWQRLSGTTDRYNFASYNHSAGESSYSLRFKGSLSNISVLPEFEKATDSLMITFWMRPESNTYSYCGTFSVGYLTNPDDTSSFVAVNTYHYNEWTSGPDDNYYMKKSAMFTGAPANARIAFRHNPLRTNYYWFVDDVEVSVAPTCFVPTDLAVSNVTISSATLGWTPHTGESAWKIFYKSSFDTSYHEISNVTQNPFVLSGLEPSTSYELYVVADCGGGDLSAPSEPLYFNTVCEEITYFPWTENFEAFGPGDFYHHCWINERIEDGTGSGSLSVFRIYTAGINGNYTSKLCLPLMRNGSVTKLALPEMDLPEGYQFKIDVFRNATGNESPNEGVRVFVSPDDSFENATELGFIYRNHMQSDGGVVTSESNINWYTYTFPIPTSGPCRILLRGESTYGSGFYMDNMVVERTQTCQRPADLSAVSLSNNTARLSWGVSENTVAWNIYYKKETDNHFTMLPDVTGNTFLLEGLEAATSYQCYVEGICSDNSVSDPSDVVSFATGCDYQPIPYTCDFENENDFNCWIPISGSLTRYPYANHTDNGNYALRFGGAIHRLVALPEFEMEANQLQISFWARPSMYNNNRCGTLMVGYMTDITDLSTFTAVNSYNSQEWSSTLFAPKTEYLFEAPPGARIVFLNEIPSSSNAYYYWYLDDVEVTATPLCIAPSGLTVSDVTFSSAVLGWIPRGNETSWKIRYRKTTAADYTEIDSVTGSTYTLTGLESGTRYEFQVVSICDTAATSNPSVTKAFTTLCGTITEFPWSEDFESVTMDNEENHNLPECWSYINETETPDEHLYPRVYQSLYHANSGSRSVEFYSRQNPNEESQLSDQYVLLPPMEGLSTLRMVLYARAYSISDHYDATFHVGVMEGDEFVELQSTTLTNTAHHPFTFYFDQYTGTGNRIAIKIDAAEYNSEHSFCRDIFIDDILVEEIPACATPSDLVADGITSNTATLNWTSHGDETLWNLYYKKSTDTTFTKVDEVSKPYTLGGLSGSSTYQFFVKAVCDEGEWSQASEVLTFSTECSMITEFPWTEGFETTERVYSGSFLSLPLCWDHINTTPYENYTAYPTVFGNIGHTGLNSLMFYSYYNASLYPNTQDQYAILPAMANLNTLRMKFFARKYYDNDNSGSTVHVGVMEDGGFVELQTITPASTSFMPFMILFDTYTGTGNRIAIKMDAASSETSSSFENRVYIDDITVEIIPSCSEPTMLTVENITESTAQLSWAAIGNESSWNLYYKKESDPAYTLIPGVATPYQIEGLEPSTDYHFYVTTVCTDGSESEASVTVPFTTDCLAQPLPYAYDFEDATPFQCWGVLSGLSGILNTGSNNHTNHGSNYLRFSGSLRNVVTLPGFEMETNGLQVTFWTRPESMNYSQCGTFSVGYLTDASDTSTFVAVNTYSYDDWSSNTYIMKKETFENAPAGARIAFRQNANHDNYYWYVDDVDVRPATDCNTPADIAVSGISASSATVSWTTGDTGTSTNIYYKRHCDNDYIQLSNVPNPFTLTGLMPGTYYDVHLASSCDTSNEDLPSEEILFSTECMPNPIPYYYDFETEDPYLCWQSLSGTTDRYNSEVNNHTEGGTHFLRFNGSLSNLMVLPEFDMAANELQISFWTCPESYTNNNCGSFSVGYMTDVNDNSTFTPVKTFQREEWSQNTYKRKVVSFSGAPAGARIAFRHNANSSNWFWFVDDVMVIPAVPCQEPDSLEANEISYSTATLSWAGESDSYNVRYRTADTIFIAFEDSFENGVLQWVFLNCDASTGLCNTSHTGDKSFQFHRNTLPPQYLISKTISNVTEGCRLSFYCRDENNDTVTPGTFKVGFSTTTDNIEAFTFSEELSLSSSFWTYYDIPVPEGTRHLAFQYTSVGVSSIYLDDIMLGVPVEAGEWQTVTANAHETTLSGLQHNTLNEVQVQSDCGPDGTSDWNPDALTFSTLAGIIPSYVNVSGELVVCQSETTTLTATSDVEGSFTWSNGATGAQVSVGAGSYTVTVTTASDDELSASVTVVSKPTSSTEIYQTACGSYEWNGNTYTQSGDFPMTFTAANGCDSVVTLHLTVNSPVAELVEATACDSYEWNGNTYTASGNYTITFTAANGCDSIVALHLTVNPTYSVADNRVICPAALPYTWNGITFESAGTQVATLQTVNGCDSIVTMTVTVNDSYEITERREICESDLPYPWNGFVFTTSGIQSVTLNANNGCDSVVMMMLTVHYSTNDTVKVSACDEYVWNGVIYTESGDYTETFTNIHGCDSVVTLRLTVNAPVAELVEATACGSYEWNGTTYTESGDYPVTFTKADGCDSVVTLRLTVNSPVAEFVEATACDSYDWNGNTYNQSGDFPMTFTAANGCDSIVTLHLTINKSYHLQENRVICSAALPYTWNGITFTQAGTQTLSTQTSGGCDSVVTMTVIINDAYEVHEMRDICEESLPYTWNNFTFTASGTQSVILLASNGCDSVVTMTLTVHQPEHVHLYESTCDSYLWNGVTYSVSGNYSQAFVSKYGCDSVVTLHLTVNAPVAELVEATACGSYEWNGNTYTQSGDYPMTFTAANGCDSTVTLHLTVNQPVAELVEATACGSYEWNGNTYTQSGDFPMTFTAANGCDSTVTLHLTVNQPVTTDFAVETSNACYTWNGQEYCASGDFTQTFTAANGCDSVVTLHLTVGVGLGGYDLSTAVVLFPNPANDYVNIRIGGDMTVTAMEVFDAYGKRVMTAGERNHVPSTERIKVSSLADGMYFVRVTTERGTVTKPFVVKR